jgi:transposase-like protein
MPAHGLSEEQKREAIAALEQAHGSQTEAAKLLGLSRETYKSRLHRARASAGPNVDHDLLKVEAKRMRSELASLKEKHLDQEAIRRQIIGLQQQVEQFTPPNWTLKSPTKESAPGVPTLFLSDLHWGEVVHPSEINGVNEYNLEIARRRLKSAAETAIELLRIISPKMEYPGIVCALGGDMISGNIHEELQASNELQTMPTVLDLFGHLVALIKLLADTFGRVFLPCVGGNHGRDTHKIWSKGRNHTSFDWLLYCFLAKHFEGDRRVTFFIPDGPDAYYRIYSHRYLLTHGDQFRGGDGVIGALGPIIRGDHKKRSRNAQVDMAYETMLLGHWHQYIHLTRLIVNGSLKGMDEYAYSNNFGFEPPQQALWLTHPRYGITYRMPVQVDRSPPKTKSEWVSLKIGA